MRAYFSILVILLMPALIKGQGIFIPGGISVTANDGALILKKNWINNGTFIHNAGTVRLAGDTQVVRGAVTTAFNNVTVAPGSITNVQSPQSIKRVLLSNGTLHADSNLTLLSTVTQTALIDGAGVGEVLGDVIMQRYISKRFGYKYFSAPFQAATVSQFSNEVDLSSTFPLFYKYDENVSTTGWVRYTADTGHLLPLLGYAANFGNDTSNITTDMTGVVNNHSLSIEFYNHNMTFTQGFNLVGNPYPSPVDWDASGWTRTNIDNAIYYFNNGAANQYKGTYSSYINGVSSDGIANNIIPAMQGFFVHVATGSYPVHGTLGVINAVRINDLNPGFHKYAPLRQYPLLRLNVSFEEHKNTPDPLVIYFEEKATPAFDAEYDALKMMNTDDNVPNLFATILGARLSINALPVTKDSILMIPLGLKTEKPGWIHFDLSQIANIPEDMGVYFLDMGTSTCQNMRTNTDYKVYLNDGDYENRFFLSFYTQDELPLTQNDVFTAYGNNGKIYVIFNLLAGGDGEIVICNLLGQELLRQNIDGYGRHEFNAPWSAGIYMVSYYSKGRKNTKKVFLGYQ